MARAVAIVALLAACAGARGPAGPPKAAAAPASAGAGAAEPARAAGDAVPAPRVVLICQTERPTGSNIAKRVCFRQEDLDRARSQAQDDLVRAIQQSSAQPRRD